MKQFRSLDRQLNLPKYPQVHYPEIYLLYKGYNLFYSVFPVRVSARSCV